MMNAIKALQGVRPADDGKSIVVELIDGLNLPVRVQLPVAVAEQSVQMIEAALFIAANARSVQKTDV